jgi:hypothetical protein
VAYNRELFPTQLLRKGDRIRCDCSQIERPFRRFGRAVSPKVHRSKAEAFGIKRLEHWLEAVGVAEPTVKKDGSNRTVTVDDMAHDHHSSCSIAANIGELPGRRRMNLRPWLV